METQTATQSQTQSENAMERFVRKTRALFGEEPDLDKRWNALRPILAELLADPDVIAGSKQGPDCVPANGRAENLLFYELGFFKVAFWDLKLHRLRHRALLSHPQVPIQRSVLDGFRKMFWGDVVFTGEIRDRADNFENPNNSPLRFRAQLRPR